MPLKKLTEIAAEDHLLEVAWSPDGALLAATPSNGSILILDPEGTLRHELPGHGLSNGIGSWSQDHFVTAGSDGKIRLYHLRTFALSREIFLGRHWIEHAKWSPDGRYLAAASGRSLVIFDAAGEKITEFTAHKSSVCDFAWNPRNPREIVSVCDGGAHMWRVGETEAYARFDWGGASLLVAWSLDGRWAVTGDQTPSVHLFDFTRNHPLHIQGYEAKVKALSFNADSTRLASGGGPLVTVWNCTGEAGPEGSVPNQLQGHAGDSVALHYHPGEDLLASGGMDGLLILFKPETRAGAAGLEKLGSPATAVRWSPDGRRLAAGTESGRLHLFSYQP